MALLPSAGRSAEMPELPVHLDEVAFDSGEVLLTAHSVDSLVIAVTTRGMTAYPKGLGAPLWMHPFPSQDHALGIPIFQDDVALYFTYRGKGKYGPEESGDALISAVRLTDGELLWSSYLPGYLPLERRIDGDRCYLTCSRVGKPITLEELSHRFEQPMRDRGDTWILALDLMSGELLWHAKTRYWASYVGTVSDAVFFAEQVGDGRNQKSVLLKREKATGAQIWRAEAGLDRTDYWKVLSHPRGIVAFSNGRNGTISHLLHPLTGEVMGRLTIPTHFYDLRGDTLYTLGVGESIGYKQRLLYGASQWNGFAPIDQITVDFDHHLLGSEWYLRDDVQEQMAKDLPYWAVMNTLPPRGHRKAFYIDTSVEGKHLYLPDTAPTSFPKNVFPQEDSYLMSVRQEEGISSLFAISVHLTEEPYWLRSFHAKQAPVWCDRLQNDRAIVAFDGKVLACQPENGVLDTLWNEDEGYTLAICSFGETFVVVNNDGLDLYGQPEPVEELDEELPEEEMPIVLEVANPLPTATAPPAVNIQPIAAPPLVAPEPKPEPEKRMREVQGWRIQVMYLSHTAMPRIQALSKELGKKTGLEAIIGERGTAHVIQLGAFEDRARAVDELKRIRNLGYGDAFLVKSNWKIPE